MTQLVPLTARTLLGLLLLCAVTNLSCSQERNTPEAGPQARNTANGYDVNRRHLEVIPPGTVIGNGPPRGWSNLIVKSHPRPGSGDVKAISASTVQLASFMFTAMLANVQPEQTGNQVRYRLTHLAVGLGTPIGGADTIVSPDTYKRLGARLGFLGPTVLEKAQEKLPDTQLAAYSRTMAVIDAPALMLRDGRHRPVVLRYVLLVDPMTGRLDTLLWLIDQDERGGYAAEPAGDVQWLPTSKLEDCVLNVDSREFNALGLPTETAFAITHIPQGQKEIPLPAGLKEVAARSAFTPSQAQTLEVKLREALAQAASR